jgi:16S rRNA (uracil1498-N3)-methyltransferase
VVDRRPPPPVTLHRFVLAPGALDGRTISFPPEQARQIRTVLRLQPSERVIVLDGSGTEAVVCLEAVGAEVMGTVEERRSNTAEPSLRLVLYQGLIKGAKFEMVLQKGTEIGIAAFVPVKTERAVPAEPSESRQRRYQTIAQEAAEQCGRGKVPPVEPAIPLAQALDRARGEGTIVFPWEGEEAAHLNRIEFLPDRQVHLFIGPEGGFSPVEARLAAEAGAKVVTLGKRVLRAETAALVAATLILGWTGDLG